ncbi:MAG: polysaccharide biosynthesis C-terminal domain-containing protein [Oscillospiraceae bacterium]|nr:polysaccharide biosynthesis C-terminal domain-containing protein [Oscillospiraceae bacterium]
MKKQGFLYGSVILMVSAFVTKVIGAMFKLPLANMLGGTGMGYFSSAYSLFMTVYAVSVTGLPAAVAKATAEACRDGENPETVDCIRDTALKMFGIVGAAASLAVALGAYPFCRYVTGDMAALPAVIAISPCIFASCLASVYKGSFEGRRNMYPTAISQVIEAVVKLCVGLILCGGVMKLAEDNPSLFMRIFRCKRENIEKNAMVYGAAASVAGVTLSSFAGLLYMICQKRLDKGEKRVYNKERRLTCERRRIAVDMAKIAVPAALGALVTNLTSVIDLATLMRSLKRLCESDPQVFSFLTDAGIALEEQPNFIYGSFAGLAVTVFNLVPAVTNMLGKGMLPLAAAANARGDRKKLGECAFTVLFSAALISVPAGGGLCVMAKQVLELLFSGNSLEIQVSARPLAVLALALPFLCISSAAFALFTAVGRADIPVKLMTLGTVVKLIGNIILTAVPQLNVIGAAIFTLLCYAVICTAAVLRLRDICGFDFIDLLPKLVGITAGTILCCEGAVIAERLLWGAADNRVITVISCAFGAFLYILGTKISSVITRNTVKMLIS